jgi:hypothetical protein
MMKRLCDYLIKKLSAWGDIPLLTVTAPKQCRTYIVQAVSNLDCTKGVSGEWKRHQMFAAMLKKYPSLTQRQVQSCVLPEVCRNERSPNRRNQSE